jgi:hypothetical protein
MTRLEDRRRTLCPDGRLLVTGVAPIADAWASTNPTLGRGTTMAWPAYRALEDVAHLDAGLLRGWFRIAGLVASGADVFGEDGFLRRLARAARHHAQSPAVITRERLVALAQARVAEGSPIVAPPSHGGKDTRPRD